jgi:hypothetical protein
VSITARRALVIPFDQRVSGRLAESAFPHFECEYGRQITLDGLGAGGGS